MNRIENGQLVKNKLTGLIGIIIDNKAQKKKPFNRMEIYYPAEKVPLCTLIGRSLFSYGGEVCFREYSCLEEVELVENKELV